MDFFAQLGIFDYVILGLLLLSMLIGLWRGFIVEFMSILPWVGAAAITFYGTPYILPHFYKMLSKSFLTEALAMISLFAVSCLFLSVLRPGLREKVRESTMSGLDRLLGLLYGGLRAFVIYGAVYILILALTPYETWPDFVKGASTMPYINRSGHLLAHLLPISVREKILFPDGNDPLPLNAEQESSSTQQAD